MNNSLIKNFNIGDKVQISHFAPLILKMFQRSEPCIKVESGNIYEINAIGISITSDNSLIFIPYNSILELRKTI